MLADLGRVPLKRGNTAQAPDTWNAFFTCADGVRSVRIDDACGDIAARLPADFPVARELTARIAARIDLPA